MIYLDYAASTPMSEAAIEAYTHAAQHFYANTQSSHDAGTDASHLLEAARSSIASHINGEPSGVYFTSGGTESNILALRSLVKMYAKGHLITCAAEHSSVLHTFSQLEQEGYEVTYLSYDHNGHVLLSELLKTIREDTILVSIAFGNSEIGAVQSMKEIGEELAKRHILFHTDAVQAFGKIAINVKEMHISALSVSSHKVYGPKGVGACYIAPSLAWRQNLPGTVHEKGFRPGTVNVPGIMSFAAAAEETIHALNSNQTKYTNLRAYLVNKLTHPNIVIEGEEGLRHIIGLRIKGLEGQYVMLELNRKGIAISTGSACSVGQQQPSKTLRAMGRSDDEARELIRISFGKRTTQKEIEKIADVFHEILTRTSVTKI
ncbi:IscS subfamily cysteine desulfurase [Alkalihalobacillus hwajinpoensis]|uniref:IscS subfamily cysteine desulfurase n=1 Tax=Guptibacillus hwajinpoensis TaxID=208199 RepID=UPI001883F6A6|nr:IscS subfamily cysteine desulfurase [Pseudalkalibacillus hwajinpoensis]MBF0706390.1 IscS subfamily cysteine desulfurase [Pseudalkalibacillus hwajinpoensis]